MRGSSLRVVFCTRPAPPALLADLGLFGFFIELFVSMSAFVAFFSPCTGDRQQGLGELDEIMSVAQRARSVASTAMNAQSSRSHSVFTLWLTGFDASTGTTLKVRALYTQRSR